MDLVLEMNMDNAAFQDNEPGEEAARILREVARKLEDGHTIIPMRDYNGNKVGAAKIVEDNLKHRRNTAKSAVKEAKEIAKDCHDYFIKGYIGKKDGGLNDLFNQSWQREREDYYPDISELCLNWEVWLGAPHEWTEDELLDFATQFQNIVPDSPNYGIETDFQISSF